MTTKFLFILLIQSIGILTLNANNISVINQSDEKRYSSPIIIKNQSWVTTQVLKENELIDIIKKYPEFKIIKFDNFYGALIQYNHKDKKTIEKLEYLKQEPGIYRIFNKVDEPKNSFELYTPQ